MSAELEIASTHASLTFDSHEGKILASMFILANGLAIPMSTEDVCERLNKLSVELALNREEYRKLSERFTELLIKAWP